MSEESLEPKTFKDVVRKFIPRFLLQQHGIIRRLGPGAGRIYAGLRLKDVLGMRTENEATVPTGARSFVFVCFGNIMRSAAGLHATPGRETHTWMQEAAADLGISVASHRAKLLTGEMVDAADAIFAMDFQNKAELLTLYPDASNKIYMLSAYAEGPWRNREIPDPYLGDLEVTRHCAKELQTCIRNLLSATVFSSSKHPRAYEAPLARR